MIPKTIAACELQLITPCYCAGANQMAAELRIPSFRGELRWWFRCLGGTREQESAVFGSSAGKGRASGVALRVLNIKNRKESYSYKTENSPPKNPNSGYITYFLNDRASGARAALPPGTRFTLELNQLREIGAPELSLLELAWSCLCNLGAIGARKTRALGAYAPFNQNEQKVPELLRHPIVCRYFRQMRLMSLSGCDSYLEPEDTRRLLTHCARILYGYRRDNRIHPTGSNKKKSAPQEELNPEKEHYFGTSVLGNAIRGRQSSAVRFRPVLVDNKLQLCILKAPDITLSAEARKHDIDSL